jgi:L-alanine-DL-glutamate epimerase-like enolase superfamily enzyme
LFSGPFLVFWIILKHFPPMNLKFSRRSWMRIASLAAAGSFIPKAWSVKNGPAFPTADIPDYEKPLFNLPARFSDPVIIESVELLQRDGRYFVRTRAASGQWGIVNTKQLREFIPIFERLVAPIFTGKDARDIESLTDLVYLENYKLVGQSLWCPLAYIEQSIFDLLGRISGKPAGELMGGRIRDEIPVYLSGSARELSAEEEVDIYVRGVEETGARAVKFKIGGRMSRNADAWPGRTDKLLELARKRLGNEVLLFADANGSYDAGRAIEVGRMLESLDFRFFEEPCPWQEYSETRKVTQTLDIPVACGEQDSSLWQFNWMMENHVMDIAQCDLNYNGGFTRSARVARMAEKSHMEIIPHNTQTGIASVNILQFASRTPNIGSWIEYPWRKPQQPESWYSPNFIIRDGKLKIPEGPGLGVEIDPDYLAAADLVSKIS